MFNKKQDINKELKQVEDSICELARKIYLCNYDYNRKRLGIYMGNMCYEDKQAFNNLLEEFTSNYFYNIFPNLNYVLLSFRIRRYIEVFKDWEFSYNHRILTHYKVSDFNNDIKDVQLNDIRNIMETTIKFTNEKVELFKWIQPCYDVEIRTLRWEWDDILNPDSILSELDKLEAKRTELRKELDNI